MRNPPLALLLLLLVACTQLWFVILAPNRILWGRPVVLFAVIGNGTAAVLAGSAGVLVRTNKPVDCRNSLVQV